MDKAYPVDKETIIRNFSKYASTYDKYADIQKCAASELLGLMREDGFRRILEIGCGTGNYTLLLRERFKNASLKAIDISGKMIDVASEKLKDKSIEFIVADAETVDIREDFDCITSNASFQWFSDLGKTIKKYSAAIKKGGIILFSVFGPATFRELNASLRDVFKEASTVTDNFMGKKELIKLLEENFKKVRIKEAFYEESFPCLKDLLHKIKFSGIRGNGMNGGTIFTPRALRGLEKVYLNKFKRISATYQVFYCEGRR
ncbi:MAG: malonyl-ACP O-methyltransferase BioC [Candidatus Omnitrophota bacterium]|nr:malonyl-ACP O-methyltransferase BioC [Candidatus Omnitrophota bacterium]